MRTRKSIRTQVRSLPPSRKALMPFSLILEPDETSALRKIAGKEGVAIAVVIRRAIHTVIGRVHPELEARLIESETDAFLDELATRYPGKMLSPAKRSAFKKRLAESLK